MNKEEVVELDVAGLGAEDVPGRLHSDRLTTLITSVAPFMATFMAMLMVLEDADPVSAVEVEGELG